MRWTTRHPPTSPPCAGRASGSYASGPATSIASAGSSIPSSLRRIRRIWLPLLGLLGSLAIGVPSADAASRLLRPLGCFSNVAIAGCDTLAGIDGPGGRAFSPDGKQLYLSARDSNALWIYDRDPAINKLTRRAQCFGTYPGCKTETLLISPSAVAVSPDGNHVYVGTADPASAGIENALLTFNRAADGSLSFASCVSESTTCGTARPSLGSIGQVIATNDNVYVTGFGANAVSAFSRSGNSLTFLNCIGDAGCATDNDRLTSPTDLSLTPNGKWLVVTNYHTPYRVHVVTRASDGSIAARNDVQSCATSTAAVANCGSAPATAENTASAMTADGRHVYVSSREPYGGKGESVLLFDLDQETGNLTWRQNACWVSPGQTIPGCAKVTGLEGVNEVNITPDGAEVYAASLDRPADPPAPGGHIVAFDRAADGMLTPQALPDGCLSGSNNQCAALPGGDSMIFFTIPSPDSTALYAMGEQNATDRTRLWSFTIDRPPVCTDVATNVGHNSATAFKLTCADPDGDAVAIGAASQPAHGTLNTIAPDGTVIYSPASGFSGADSFTFVATSRGLSSAPATASLSVAAPPPAGGTPTGPAPGPGPGPATPVQITSEISTQWATRGSVTRVRRILVRNIPAGATVEVRCVAAKKARRACPFKRRKGTVRNGRATLTGIFKNKRLRVGATLEIRITAPGMIGKAVKYKMRKGKLPLSSRLCVKPGATSASRC